VLLGNWREDDEVDSKRMMDYIQGKEAMSLALLKKQEMLGPQLTTVKLTQSPVDGVLRYGDTVLLKASMNDGALSVSLGQKLVSPSGGDLFGVFTGPSTEARVRNAIKIVSGDGMPEGEPVTYGSKIYFEFSSNLGVTGYLASARASGTPTATQLINKQEVYMRPIELGSQPLYECAWTLLPEQVDERIVANGTAVATGSPVVISHCFTNKRLAAVNVGIPTDFGVECGVCAHTYTDTGKVNKLMRETIGRPSNGLISRSETTENLWSLVFT